MTNVPVSFWHSILQANAETSFRILQSFMQKDGSFSEIFSFHFEIIFPVILFLFILLCEHTSYQNRLLG